MKLHYYKSPHGNVGDDLNPWLWEKLLPDFFDDNPETLFVGIGTLLSPRIPAAKKTIIFGSGMGYGPPPEPDDSWDFVCVRGPETAKNLNLPLEKAVTDPAILLTLFEPPRSDATGRISFMPHHLSCTQGAWEKVCETAGIQFIDARKSVDEVLGLLRNTRLLITEAMHGAIFADALRIPWIAVHSHERILAFKWQDWMRSLELEETFNQVAPVWKHTPGLSFSQRIKHGLKRNLTKIGVQPASWVPPPPLASTSSEIEQRAEILTQLADTISPQLSEDRLQVMKKETLLERLEQVKQRYR